MALSLVTGSWVTRKPFNQRKDLIARDSTSTNRDLSRVNKIDRTRIQQQLGEIVRSSEKQTLKRHGVCNDA
jgi:hypothetical protein